MGFVAAEIVFVRCEKHNSLIFVMEGYRWSVLLARWTDDALIGLVCTSSKCRFRVAFWWCLGAKAHNLVFGLHLFEKVAEK